VSTIELSIVLSSTHYTAGTGIPFDIAAALNSALGNQESPVNAADIIPYQIGMSTGGFFLSQFAVGTPTYNTNTDASSARSQNITYATCPCTIKMFGTGSAQYAALSEIQTADISGTLNFSLKVVRGGGSI
jgi:hypothetical protein